jgi:hypothetical protein
MIDHDSGLPPQRADPPLSNSRRILVITPRSLLGILVSLSLASLASAEKPTHFDPKGKPPSQHTIRGQKALRASLPFDDERDFAEAKKGFIAARTSAPSTSCSGTRSSTASTPRSAVRPCST